MRLYRGLTKDGKLVNGWYIEMPNRKLEVKDLDNGAFSAKKKNVKTYQSCIAYLPGTGEGLKFSIVIPETVCQSTGLKDKNGKDIYEGDILTTSYYPYIDEEKQNYVGVVEWIYVSFQVVLRCVNLNKCGISDGINELIEDFSDFEIIGNIHQNPELLEGKQ